jgi:ferredoxin
VTVAVNPLKAVSPPLRAFSSSAEELDPHGGFERLPATNPEDKLKINLVDRNDQSHVIDCKVGDNLLFLCRVLQESQPNLYLEGACEASLACSTCHVILDDDTFDKLEIASDEEEDMLDQAACLSPTSRLACQLKLTKDWDGATVHLPKHSRNFYVDGHVPQPH